MQKLKGSKYVETQKRIFRDGEYKPLWPSVAEKLEIGKKVLFIGLGCDVAALKSFLKFKQIDTSNLFTVDLICFGPTSPIVHRQYTEALEKKYNSKIISFTVRGKKFGWVPAYIMAEFENGKKFDTHFYNSDYGIAFSRYARPSCYQCKFRGRDHQADITVGDYWGLTKDMNGYNNNGVSIFIVRTQRGEELIKKINKQGFTLQSTDVTFAIDHNHMYFECRQKPKDHEKFFQDLQNFGLHRAVKNSYGSVKYFLRPLRNRAAKILPYPIKNFLKKYFFLL